MLFTFVASFTQVLRTVGCSHTYRSRIYCSCTYGCILISLAESQGFLLGGSMIWLERHGLVQIYMYGRQLGRGLVGRYS